MKTCRDCRIDKPLTDFYFHKKGPQAGKPQSYCRACVSIRTDRYQEKDWRKTLDRNARWRDRNKERVKLMRDASNAVNQAIAKGLIQRGTVCTKCNEEKYCEAAHFDYSKKLEFVWLCRSCHKREDHARPKSIAVHPIPVGI